MGTLEIAQGNADTVGTLEIAQANIGADDKFGTELGGVEATGVVQGTDAHAYNVNAVDTLEITQANIGADDQLGTELGGVEATSALQIAFGAQEITLAGDKLQNPPQQPLSWNNKSQKELLLAREYCTQACLLGLKRGSSLDEGCPNVASHRISEGTTHHAIDAETFIRLAGKDLAEDLEKSTHVYCVRLDMSGTTGTLFKLVLPRYEYIFVGKGTTREYRPNLQHEAFVYEHRLKSLQGEAVPVYLGSIEVDLVIRWSRSSDWLVHMILMSWSGDMISKTDVPIPEVNRTLQEVVLRGVIHNDVFKDSKDWASVRKNTDIWSTDKEKRNMLSQMRKAVCYPNVRRRNMLWNAERKRVMLIDLERSILLDDESDEPDQPDETEQLDQPEKLGQPEQLNQPGQPEQLEQTGQLNQPEQTEQLDQPEKLEQPKQLKHPEQPEQPEKTEQFDQPEQTQQLDQPEKLEQPEQPQQPKHPGHPEHLSQKRKADTQEKLPCQKTKGNGVNSHVHGIS